MAVTTHTDLRTLAANTYVDGTYSIYNPQIGATRNGKPFLKCLLRDATGEVAARQWSFDEKNFADLEGSGFVWVAGHSQLYNGQVQFIIEQIKPATVSEEEMAALLPTTSRDIGEMFERVQRCLGTLEHPAMKALAETYLGDEQLMRSFRLAPAAMNVHHAWIGGLLEHTLQLLELAHAMLPLYPQLNRDLVLMGLFLHDLGKTVELSWDQGFNYTADGNLIGHVVRGAIWLQVKAAVAAKSSGHKLPGDALRVLQHIIISHHGQLEYGAAKSPATPEAIFVSQLDDLDAKTQLALTAAGRDDQAAGGPFTDKIWALGTRIYRPDPLAT
ncbi:MAG: HD domain-containing protein [Planctomycetes bacterium]|nr:HD domain-containing protein [Planctomycetota bacterium]